MLIAWAIWFACSVAVLAGAWWIASNAWPTGEAGLTLWAAIRLVAAGILTYFGLAFAYRVTVIAYKELT